MSYAYRLPRRYRYRRRGKLSNRDIAIIAAVIAIAAAGAGHKAVAGAAGDAASGLRSVAVTSGSEDSFIRAVLADLGAPASQANVASLASWFPHEFPSWPPAATDNPMASTMPEPGATVFNSAGVRNYTSPSQGAAATAATLADGNYPGIDAALRSGFGICGPGFAGELSTWSGGGYSEVC